MKKKVAIFANGWSNEYLKLVLGGICKRAKGCDVDLYTFINYSSGSPNEPNNIGEGSIFKLPDLSTFDGIILLANTINLREEREFLNYEALKYQIPAVSLEYELDGIPCLYTDTYSGIYELTSHLINVHGARNIVYVSEPEDNKENILRMQAVNDALEEIGKQIEPENIIPGEWSCHSAYSLTLRWLEEHEKLPDAFVCANDEMAIGVYLALKAY